MNAETPFPLLTVRPAANFKNAWVALLLDGEAPFDGSFLEKLLCELGLARALEVLPCVVPVAPATINPGLAAVLPGGRCVLRIPVATASDPAQHAMLAALQEGGFGLVVEGFPAADAKLPAGITSLAVACPGHEMPSGFGDWLRKLPGPHLALGTTAHVCPGFCKFHWLGGHLAGNVAPAPGGDPTTRSLLLKLLALVMADADADQLETLIRRDPNLSYHLLRLVNSVAFSPSRKIESFSQAIAMLGRRQLQRWLQLLLYVRPQGGETASPLLPRAAMRAALMEGLARRQNLSREDQEQAYMVGMFSLLDELLGMPLAEIVGPLNLPEIVLQALLEHSGLLGGLLATVPVAENGSFAELDNKLAAAGIEKAAWAVVLIEAARWAAQISQEA